MSAIGGEIGTLAGGGPNNSRFQAQGANILNPVTVDQANTAYGTAQDALAQQQALAIALQPQGQQGINSQTALTQALMAQAQGQGPNPAQAQLAQATGANTANQAALMAGQRGAASNVGLMARQAAQQGAATQQQAVGQAATMQAQQQLAAQQQLQTLAGNQIAQQGGAVGSYNQAAQGEQGNLLNSINAQNNANVAMQSNINNANAGLAQTNANNAAAFTGGNINSLTGAGAKAALMAHGGMVENPKLAKVPVKDRMPMPDHIKGMANIYHPNFAYGGPVTATSTPTDVGSPNAISNKSNIQQMDLNKKKSEDTGGKGLMAGGSDDAVGSSGAAEGAAMVASKGGPVPGKAKVRGDSLKNDTVSALLSPGEIVIPRHVLEGDDAPEKAKAFVAKILEQHQKKSSGGEEESDFKDALKKAILSRKKK